MKTKTKIDPMKGVVKPELLIDQLRLLRDGNANAKNYIRGSIQWLERHPPNPLIVPVLRKALERFT